MMKSKETEQRIIEMISHFDEEYFDTKIAGDPEWALSYHLCSLRCGLLNWYDFHGENALDIGAGFGALTGILCDHFSHVDAVECDSARSAALRVRYKHREGLKVHTSDIREYTPDVRYDCILIVDFAEEYAGDFSALLKQALSWLKKDGVILLGLRNRSGMKYSCGMVDEYMQEPFGQYKNISLYTRKDIVQMLEYCGVSNPYWYYPLPDSRYPQIIYSEEDMPEHSVRDRIVVYDPFNSPVISDENDVIDHVLSEGILPEQTNDYLLAIRREPDRNQRHIVSAVISTDRECGRSYKTIFYNDHSVEKRALFPEGIPSLRQSADNHRMLKDRGIPVIEQEWREDHLWMPRVEETTLQDKLAQVLRCGEISEFYRIMDRLYQLILESDPV
ncbi:MAG: class I SAM-dependent methyltransferase, partial [Solobacterium sp.]|nr:class I SAM-dependent methyltransferase [Solobacterium sp.]